MTNSRRSHLRVILCTIAISIAFFLEPLAAAAQEMKRGAGSMSRSAGSTQRGGDNRRGSSLGSSRRGIGGSMKSERKSSSSDDSEFGSKKKKTKKSDDDDDSDGDSYSSSSDDDDEEDANFGERTLGRACMYGGNGEVIFRPEGSVCRGDVPAAPSDSSATSEMGMEADEPSLVPLSAAVPAPVAEPTLRVDERSEAAPARRPAVRPRVRRPRIGEGKPRGCIFNRDGSVLHAPKGLDCD